MGRLVAQIRNDDPERLARVLDAKKRLIGIDVGALEAQTHEKLATLKAQEDEESRRVQAEREVAAALAERTAAASKARTQWNREVADYRSATQARETRREWDLSRPDCRRLDSPARIGDDDPRCGPASMQRFDGEDLEIEARTEAQRRQAAAWWESQMDEADAARAAAAAAAAADAAVLAAQVAAQRAVRAAEGDVRRAAAAAAAEENARLAAARAAARAEAAASEAAAAEAEKRAIEESAWLREDPRLAASALSATRVRKDHFKGLSPAETAAVRAAQQAQVEEAKRLAAVGEEEEARAAAERRAVAAELARQALAAAQARKAAAAALRDSLQRQVADKTTRDGTLRETYAGCIELSYFEQFGKSHR